MDHNNGHIFAVLAKKAHISNIDHRFPSLFLPSCSQRSRCERADEPYRFAASLNQCVKVSVYPDSIAVSEPSVPVSILSSTRGAAGAAASAITGAH